jgi:hypothetical protein
MSGGRRVEKIKLPEKVTNEDVRREGI